MVACGQRGINEGQEEACGHNATVIEDMPMTKLAGLSTSRTQDDTAVEYGEHGSSEMIETEGTQEEDEQDMTSNIGELDMEEHMTRCCEEDDAKEDEEDEYEDIKDEELCMDAREAPLNLNLNLTDKEENRLSRIGTWNANKGCDHQRVLDLMIKGKFDLLTTQEPTRDSDTERKWAESTVRHLKETGFNAVVTKHNIVAHQESTFGRILLETVVECEGRITCQIFRKDKDAHMAVLSMCGVCSGNENYSDGTSKNELRKQVLMKLNKVINKMESKHCNLAVFVLGDLQEEIGLEACHQKETKGLKKSGTLRYLIKNDYRCDALDTLQEGVEYKTRQALGGKGEKSALDYGWSCQRAVWLVERTFIDKTLSRLLMLSDHDLVAMDLDLSVKVDDTCDETEEVIGCKAVSQIKLKKTGEEEDGTPIFEFDDTQFKTRKVVKDQALLESIREEAEKEMHMREIDKIWNRVENLTESVKENARQHNKDPRKGEMPPRRKVHADELEEITEGFMDVLKTIIAATRISQNT